MVQSEVINAFLFFDIRYVVIFDRLAKHLFFEPMKKSHSSNLDQFQSFYTLTCDARNDKQRIPFLISLHTSTGRSEQDAAAL